MFGDIQEYVRAYIDMSVSGNILFFKLEQHFKLFRLDTPVLVKDETNISYIQNHRLSVSIPNLFVFIGINETPGYKTNNQSTVLHNPGTNYQQVINDVYDTMALHDEFIFQQMTLHDEPILLSTLCSTFYEESKLPYDCITIISEVENPIARKIGNIKSATEQILNLTELL